MGTHFKVKEIELVPAGKISSEKNELPHEPLSSIREMAETFGISIRALRFYEDRGLLHPRRQGSVRYYDARAKRHLKLILKGKQLGFTLAEIHDMIRTQDEDVSKTELELFLQPEQIIAQLEYLEHQRGEIDIAIQALRDAHQHQLKKAGAAKAP
jgi:DNA-binding transcriptional MerR regulator